MNGTKGKLEAIGRNDGQQKWVVGKEINDALIERIAQKICIGRYAEDDDCMCNNIVKILKEELLK